MKIAITGAEGMLGSDVLGTFSGEELTAFSRRSFDITNLKQTFTSITDAKPDYLIHCAAYTDVDGSEGDPERAKLINGIGTRNVVMACDSIKCPVIYISSDYVFDGTSGRPYEEWDMPNPVNVYGQSKLLGENFVLSLTNRFYIVRTSWLYGKNGGNFVNTMKRLLSERSEIEVVDDQVGSPTYTGDLAVKLRELVGCGYGIYHITNSSSCSWHEFASEIARLTASRTVIKRTTTAKFNRPAPRPAYSVLNNSMTKLEGISDLRHWKDALEEYID